MTTLKEIEAARKLAAGEPAEEPAEPGEPGEEKPAEESAEPET